MIIAPELVAVGSLITNSRLGSGIAVGLLSIYTLAITVNLIRGRFDVDCGCSCPAMRQTLSGWLIIRNLGLLAAALLTFPPAVQRPLTILDWFTAVAAVATFLLIYSAANHLFAAKGRYGELS